jgi:hypothetical protein
MSKTELLRGKHHDGTGTLRHLLGPVVVVATIIILAIVGAWLVGGMPATPTEHALPPPVEAGQNGQANPELKDSLKDLLDSQLDNYKETLTRFGSNITLQALVVAVTILLIIRRSDSLKLFENTVPLSWLHFFVAILIIYLWLNFGFTLHDLIKQRIRGIGIIDALHDPEPMVQYQKALFHDASFVDGWFLTFVDPGGRGDYSGIAHSFTRSSAVFLALVLGTLVSASHASLLAILSIGCRRYLRGLSIHWLALYYVLPIAPLAVLLVSHLQFAYGGENRNWLQLYVAVVMIPFMAFLLWLSVAVDRKSYLDSVECLRRQRYRRYHGPTDRLVPRVRLQTSERTISLIGDSLSTAFCVTSPPAMLFRMWRRWQPNWFLGLGQHENLNLSVLERICAFGPARGIQHASVSARVDAGDARSLLDRLTDTWHFSHQVDELLSGSFPDILLIWIGHNDVDWKPQKDDCTHDSLVTLADIFVGRYEIQLRRLLNAALADAKTTVVVVFGLIDFRSFFEARKEAECRRDRDRRLFPYMETDYRYFVSMKPEFREGMIKLADIYNQRLSLLCQKVSEELSGTNVRVVYSNAMAEIKIDCADFLSPIDAWHPSVRGHSIVAQGAFPIVCRQAHFLGWDGPS